MFNLMLTLCLFSGISGKIQGTVTDSDTREPIQYADVIILNTELGASTDENGNFFILNVPPGVYTVEVSYMGYQTVLIENIVVEVDRTARLEVDIKQTTIEIAPITVTSELPAVKKDYVGTTYIVRRTELPHLPIDYATDVIAFQAAVTRMDTALHVRGGRATEVLYLIDNVSIIDPQTGDPAINLSKDIIDEVIFLPGGFDVEYGRAMSGVINVITKHPSDRFKAGVRSKAETPMPRCYNFGYQNYQPSVHLPVLQELRGFLSFDMMHTDDWNPRLQILPHKQRDDYTLYGKWRFAPTGKLTLTLSAVKSRSQFDRYETQWKYNLNQYRSDLREGDLEILSLNFLPDSRKLFNITLSRLYSEKIFGVKEKDSYGPFDDFTFKDYRTLRWPDFSNKNPFGANWFLGQPLPHLYDYPIIEGDYPEYQDKSSEILKVNFNSNMQVHKYHELKAGFEYTYLDLENFIYFVPIRWWYGVDTSRLIDEYHYYPKEYSLFFQDEIDYASFYGIIGCRIERFETGVEGFDPKMIISPRCGFSVMVTDKFLFRSNVGLYAQPPLYDYMYQYYNLLPLPSFAYRYLPLVGNPELRPEKTMLYEIGLQGEIVKNLSLTINVFYKDVSDLIGTRFVPASPRDYVRYQNVEHANIRGSEMILDFINSLFTGKISYTLSWARGTSSYAEEVYDLYNYLEDYDTLTYFAKEYYLDFDQRHRIFMQGVTNLPFQIEMYVFGYLGVGFPYTPPGEEGKTEERNTLKMEFQKQFDCAISKSFRIGKVSLSANFDIINVFNTQYQIREHHTMMPLEGIDILDFPRYWPVGNKRYTAAADKNHDGLLTPEEQLEAFLAFVADTEDSINAYSAPRKVRIGISVSL